MYVFLSIKVSNVILSGWLTYHYGELFTRDKNEPLDPARYFRGQGSDNPRRLPGVQCLSESELPKLMFRLDLLTEQDGDNFEVEEVQFVGAYSRRLISQQDENDEE
jgi:hypothetical protein